MTVAELLAGIAPHIPVSLAEREVRGLALDSRKVQAGDLFFALPGQHHNGVQFARAALSHGALAVVAETALTESADDAAILAVPHARRALALAAARFHGHPDRRLKLLGVTGTNGKTTTALLLASVIEAAGEKPGFVGTIGTRVAAEWRPATFTTPEAPELCALLEEMVRAGVQHCAMEVSSHALAQERVAGLSYATAGFTQLTRDHLDYHGDFESYFAAKRRLFTELLEPAALAVVNGDDPHGARLAGELTLAGRGVVRFGRTPGLELRITEEQLSLDGTRFKLALPGGSLEVRSPLIGAHNVENLALAAGMALAAGLSRPAVVRGLEALASVPGRLERVTTDRAGPLAFVDYAHTDDALRRVLSALRALGAHGDRRLLVVFGCGGDRDPGKRPLMGRAAGEGADVVVATSDNPRSEDPQAILAEVVPGLRSAGRQAITVDQAEAGGFLVEPDRRAAIALAARLARPQDVLLVAGKGHETTQTIRGEKLPFDDRLELRAALERRAA